MWPVNLPIAEAWLKICSQWRAITLGDGRVLWLGLDYSAARDGLALDQVTLSPTQWAGIRLMESVAAAVLNGQRG